ncbi:hypothetical protein BCAH1134_C0488 (plasmid) [Bacillus cereus AH1134]|nr:hypothetical protein BCAH1134_C0488 [Bacillus cereus AH1134]
MMVGPIPINLRKINASKTIKVNFGAKKTKFPFKIPPE